MSKDFDLGIVGGGVAGLVVCSVAAQLGLRVVLIEKTDRLGGDCLNYGCVPSKSLIKAAAVAQQVNDAHQFGVSTKNFSVNLQQVQAYVRGKIDEIAVHDDPERFRRYGAEVIFGNGQFADPHTVMVNNRRLTAKRFLLATGSRPFVPPIPGLDQVDFLTNETIFQLQQLPARLAILGGGVISLELAQAFQRLGAQVTVIEQQDALLPHLDKELVILLKQQLVAEGVDVRLGVTVARVSQQAEAVELTLQQQGQQHNYLFDKLLVAAGRQPNIDGLGLEKIGVKASQQGVVVDRRLRTSQKHIYAAGDVVSMPYKFTHAAEYHAGVVVSNAIFRVPKRVDYRVMPAVIYTAPEFAMVGLTEQQAVEQGVKHEVLRFSVGEVDRAITESATQGMAKVLVSKGRVVGAHILGAHAGELIAEFVLAMQANIKFRAISESVHAYPTFAQLNRRVINSYYAPRLFGEKTKRLVAFLQRWLP